MEKNTNFRNREGGRVIGGLILVGVGAALLMRNMGFFMPYWLFTWPVILILVGIFIGVKSSFRNNSWYIISLVGLYFLVSRSFPSLGLQPLFWPIMIIGLGLTFILRPGRNRWKHGKRGDEYDKWKYIPSDQVKDPVSDTITDTSDHLVVRSVFSGINKNVVSKNFQGGQISCYFGGSEIDFSQADINGQVTIRFDIAFGGAKLVVPPHWVIQNDINGTFHGFEDKRTFNSASNINPDKTLILKGSVVFGGVEIASY